MSRRLFLGSPPAAAAGVGVPLSARLARPPRPATSTSSSTTSSGAGPLPGPARIDTSLISGTTTKLSGAPTLLLTVLWMTQTIGFFGYSSWAPTLPAKEGFSVEKSVFYVALTTVGAPLGCYLASLVTDRFERKWCLVAFGTVIALYGLLYGLTFDPVFIIVFGFLVNLFERGYTALAYAYSPELFDTRSRSLGTSVSYGLGRLSNAAGPLIVAALYNGHGYQSVFYFIAGTWMVGAVALAAFGPRTRSARLAEAERQRLGVPA